MDLVTRSLIQFIFVSHCVKKTNPLFMTEKPKIRKQPSFTSHVRGTGMSKILVGTSWCGGNNLSPHYWKKGNWPAKKWWGPVPMSDTFRRLWSSHPTKTTKSHWDLCYTKQKRDEFVHKIFDLHNIYIANMVLFNHYLNKLPYHDQWYCMNWYE